MEGSNIEDLCISDFILYFLLTGPLGNEMIQTQCPPNSSDV